MTELARSNVGLDGEGHGGLIPTGTTALFTIIGSPVVQVVAPRTFNRLFAEQGVAERALSVRNPARHKGLLRVVESVAAPPLVRFDLDSLAGFDLVINATPVGMNGDPNVPHPVASLDSTSLVGEVVTLPRITPWLAAALERGCRVQYGDDMSKAQLDLVGPWWGFDFPHLDCADCGQAG